MIEKALILVIKLLLFGLIAETIIVFALVLIILRLSK